LSTVLYYINNNLTPFLINGEQMVRRIFVLLFIITALCSAQSKKFTIEDVVLNSYTTLSTTSPSGLSIIADTEMYSYIEDRNEEFVLVRSYVNSDKKEDVLFLNVLARVLERSKIEAPAKFPKITWITPSLFSCWIKTNYIEYNVDDNVILKHIQLPDDAENEEISPDRNYIAYTIGNNLFIIDKANIVTAVSDEENKDIIYGQAVHRNEFGIEKGIFWSNDSRKLAFYRMDESMVTDYPILDINTIPATVEMIKYPMAGQTSHQVTTGIFDITSGSVNYLKTGEPVDQYLTCLTWGPESKFFYIGHLNRDQNHFELYKYDVVTGNRLAKLYDETNDKFVENEHPLYFLPGDNTRFILISEKDGFEHLYLYDTTGKEIKQFTSGKWSVIEYLGFDKHGDILFTSNIDNPTEQKLYKLNMKDFSVSSLTKENGTHNISFNEGGSIYIDKFSSLNDPGFVTVTDFAKNTTKVIKKFDNPISDYEVGKTEIFKVTNQTGTDLYCRAVFPANFDSTKKYPVIVYVYGGPHVQLVKDEWARGRYRFWFLKMAQEGYIVFTVDNRGTANRGREFEQATFRQLGTPEVEDQVFALNKFMENQFVDKERIGVFGWSYGGFMTTSLMLKANDIFKVGVGGGAVIDWEYYEIMYTERYMDTPQTNPDGYKEANLLNHVDNLKGKLLLVHGTSDPTVVWQQTLLFAKAAVKNLKPLDYFPYLDHPHGVVGHDAIDLYNRITNYFLDNL